MSRIAMMFAGAASAGLVAGFGQAGPAQASSTWTVPGGVSVELSTGAVADIIDGPGNTKYVAGNFATDSNDPTWFSIGAWNGKKLTPIPGAPTGTAFSLTYDTSTSTLYAGGSFTIGASQYGVVRWDGSTWAGVADLGVGSAMVMTDNDNGTLYIGGFFTSVNGQTGYGNFAIYSNQSWSSAGATFDDLVTALVLDRLGRLYVGGMFTRWSPTSSTFGSIAVREGGAWSALGATDGRVTRLVMGPGQTLYASGSFTEADGADAYIASMRLDIQNTWQPVPSPVEPEGAYVGFSHMAFTSSGNLVLGAEGGIYSLTGSTWTRIPGDFGGPIQVVSTDVGGGLLVGGSFVSIDDVPTPGVAYRSGKQAPPAPSVVDARVLSGRIITVTWSSVASDPPVRTYRVECKAKAGPTARKQTTVRFAEITLPRAGVYACRVSARNGAGWGAWSAPSSVRVR